MGQKVLHEAFKIKYLISMLFKSFQILLMTSQQKFGTILRKLSALEDFQNININNCCHNQIPNLIISRISQITLGTPISLIAKEVGINVEGSKSCKINKHGGWNKRGGWDFLEKTKDLKKIEVNTVVYYYCVYIEF